MRWYIHISVDAGRPIPSKTTENCRTIYNMILLGIIDPTGEGTCHVMITRNTRVRTADDNIERPQVCDNFLMIK